MDLQEMVSQSQDAATVGRVYGEPHEKDGTIVIPAARVSARGGSGAARGGEHSGGGFRADAEPVGAFVIRNGEVEWKPAFDLNGTVRRGQLVGVVALLVLWAVIRSYQDWLHHRRVDPRLEVQYVLMQWVMDRLARLINTLSHILEKISETAATIAKNMK